MKPKTEKLRLDWADEEAERLFDMVRDARADDDIINAIAVALRKASDDGGYEQSMRTFVRRVL